MWRSSKYEGFVAVNRIRRRHALKWTPSIFVRPYFGVAALARSIEMFKQILTIILALTSIMLTSIARAEATDGHWWNQLNQGEKIAYVVGFIDGTSYSVTLLTVATFNAMADPKTGKFNADRAEVAKATSLGTVRALKDNLGNLTVGQVVQGLDATYSDYRNQGISVLDCAYVVIYAINGGNEAEVTRLLEVRRKQAGKQVKP